MTHPTRSTGRPSTASQPAPGHDRGASAISAAVALAIGPAGGWHPRPGADRHPARAADAPAACGWSTPTTTRSTPTSPTPPLVADIGRRMDVMYGLYAQQLSEFRPAADAPPLPVYLFAEQGRYLSVHARPGRTRPGCSSAARTRTWRRSWAARAATASGGRSSTRRSTSSPTSRSAGTCRSGSTRGWPRCSRRASGPAKTFLLGQVPPRRIRQLRSDLDHGTLVPLAQFLTVTPKAWSDVLHAGPGAERDVLQPGVGGGPVPDPRPQRRLPRTRPELPAAAARTGRRRRRRADPAGRRRPLPRAFAACFPTVPPSRRRSTPGPARLRATDGAV